MSEREMDVQQLLFLDREFDLRRYIAILNRRKAGIFGLGLLAALLAGLVVMSMTPIYRAVVTLMIDEKDPNVVSIQEVYGIDKGKREYFQTQLQIIKSRQIAEKVIEKSDLADNPEFAHKKEAPSTGGWLNWRSFLPDGLFPAEETDEEEKEEVDQAGLVARFESRLSVKPVPGSRLVEIGFEASDRKLAAQVANSIADTYIENELDSRLQMTTKAMSWLTDRLQGLRGNLEKSEKDLQGFREREKLVELRGVKTLSGEQLSALNEKLVVARQKYAEASASYRQVKAIKSINDPEVASIPAVLSDQIVGSLKSDEARARRKVSSLAKRYGPKHPKMIAAQADVDEAEMRVKRRMREVISGVEKRYRLVEAEIKSLEEVLGETKGELRQINRKGYELGVLEREVETNRQLYDLFLGRLKETSETNGMQTPNARIVDPAVPPRFPAKPRKGFIVISATLIGLFFGVLWAFLLEYLDRTLKGAGDMEQRLGLPVLGLLPHIVLKKGGGETPLQHVRSNPRGLFSESLRTVRTGVLLSGLDEPHKRIMVTSSVPKEGKTTVAVTVAESLAEMHKVLLIDTDMRRPSIGKLYGVDRSRPGLAEFVSGSAELEDCIVEVEGKNLHILAAGTIPPNPLELLSSKRFSEAVHGLAETYDQIVLDSPPVLAVSDALVLATLVSGVIYVARSDLTPYPMALDGLKNLRNSKAHVIGGVLNQVQLTKKGGYGKYGYYGDRYYGSYGYTSD